MYEKELMASTAKNPVHETTDNAIKNLSTLRLEQCQEVIGYLKDYLTDRKKNEMESIKFQIEELQSHSTRLNDLSF